MVLDQRQGHTGHEQAHQAARREGGPAVLLGDPRPAARQRGGAIPPGQDGLYRARPPFRRGDRPGR